MVRWAPDSRYQELVADMHAAVHIATEGADPLVRGLVLALGLAGIIAFIRGIRARESVVAILGTFLTVGAVAAAVIITERHDDGFDLSAGIAQHYGTESAQVELPRDGQHAWGDEPLVMDDGTTHGTWRVVRDGDNLTVEVLDEDDKLVELDARQG